MSRETIGQRSLRRKRHANWNLASAGERLEPRRPLNGDVVFGEVLHLSVGDAPEYLQVRAGDLDSDGDQDLTFTLSGREQLAVSLNNGHGDFSVPSYLPSVEGYPWFHEIADVDNDGALDVVVSTAIPSAVSVFYGNGDGTFAPAASHSTQGIDASDVVIGDLDGDGDMDIAVAHQSSHEIAVLHAVGGRRFSHPVRYPMNGEGTTGLTLGDFDDDGIVDLAAANYFANSGSKTVDLLMGNGDGSFRPAVSHDAGAVSWDLKNADLNNDGKLDLVATTIWGPSIMLGNGDGTFLDANLINTWPDEADPRNPDPDRPILQPFGFDIGDLNSDGNFDLVLSNWSGYDPITNDSMGLISVMTGRGNGQFNAPSTFQPDTYPRDVSLADFDGDLDLDLAAVGTGTGLVSVLPNETPVRRAGDVNGDGIFNSSDLILVFQAGEYEDNIPSNSTFEEGDWDGDGDFTTSDMVFAFSRGNYVHQALPSIRTQRILVNALGNRLSTEKHDDHFVEHVDDLWFST